MKIKKGRRGKKENKKDDDDEIEIEDIIELEI